MGVFLRQKCCRNGMLVTWNEWDVDVRVGVIVSPCTIELNNYFNELWRIEHSKAHVGTTMCDNDGIILVNVTRMLASDKAKSDD